MRCLRYAPLGLVALAALLFQPSPGGAEPASATIAMGDNLPTVPGWFCDPSYWLGNCETTISVGGSVTWVYPEGSTIHTTTECGASCPPTSAPGWDSGFMNVGDTFTWTFDTPGMFLYYCTLHPLDMQGTIVVEDLSTPTPAPTPSPTPTNNTDPTPMTTPTDESGPTATAVESAQRSPVPADVVGTAAAASLPRVGGPPAGSGGLSPWLIAIVGGAALAIAGTVVLMLGSTKAR